MFAWRDNYISYNGPISANDPYWTSVSLLENFETPKTAFLDSSTNNFLITPVSTVRPNLATPFTAGTGGSFVFNGTSDGMTSPTNTGNQPDGDFTWECWVRFNTVATSQGLFTIGTGSNNRNYLSFDSSVGIKYLVTVASVNQVTVQQGTTSGWSVGTWYHVALVRSSNVYNIYRNGTSLVSTSNSYVTPQYTAGINIGYSNTAGSFLYINGYISNARCVNGVAVYTGAFTPPTSPLTATQSSGTNISAITGTSTRLLVNGTNQGLYNNATFVDSSINAGIISITSAPRYTGLSPFGNTYPGSVNFNGSNFLTVAGAGAAPSGTGPYTVEGWIYFTTLTANTGQSFITNQTVAGFSFGLGISYGGSINGMRIGKTNTLDCEYFNYTFSTNTWYHVANVRSGTTIYFFVNGVQQTTITPTGASTGSYSWPVATSVKYGCGGIGGTNVEFVTGNQTNWRTNNVALYTSSFTPSTVPLTALSTTTFLQIANGAFQDVSTQGQLMISTATAIISTQQKQFGSQSVSTVASNYQTVNDATSLQFGTGDFTIEGWVYRNTPIGVLHSIISKGTSTTGWSLQINTSNQLIWTSTTSVLKTSTTTIPASTWTYFAITRTGTTGYMFINGTQEGATYSDTTNYNQTSLMYISADRLAGNALNAYLDDIRITKGVCRYTASFSAPTSAFPTS
jgi:hypothetical protein